MAKVTSAPQNDTTTTEPDQEFLDLGCLNTYKVTLAISAVLVIVLIICIRRANRLIPSGVYYALQPRSNPTDDDPVLYHGLLDEDYANPLELEENIITQPRFRDDYENENENFINSESNEHFDHVSQPIKDENVTIVINDSKNSKSFFSIVNDESDDENFFK
ncbi:hypothetical protein G9A89_013882 [Geosiphon pyriformis]|nr:hypothetical protein G9A89_013882 [Geosiphon pyriformis]